MLLTELLFFSLVKLKRQLHFYSAKIASAFKLIERCSKLNAQTGQLNIYEIVRLNGSQKWE